jgi:hypothetical protein
MWTRREVPVTKKSLTADMWNEILEIERLLDAVGRGRAGFRPG